MEGDINIPCSWSAALADTFTEQGLVNVVKDDFTKYDDYVLVLDQMNYLNLFQELISKMPPAVKDELSELHSKAIPESRKGVAYQVRRFAFIGQKKA